MPSYDVFDVRSRSLSARPLLRDRLLFRLGLLSPPNPARISAAESCTSPSSVSLVSTGIIRIGCFLSTHPSQSRSRRRG